MNKKKNIIMLLVLIVSVGLLICFKTNTIKVEGKELYASGSVYSKPICVLDINDTIKLGRNYQGKILCTGDGKLTDKVTAKSFKQTNTLIKKIKILSVSEGYYEGNFYVIPFTYKATFIGNIDMYLDSGNIVDELGQLNPATRTYRVKIKLF